MSLTDVLPDLDPMVAFYGLHVSDTHLLAREAETSCVNAMFRLHAGGATAAEIKVELSGQVAIANRKRRALGQIAVMRLLASSDLHRRLADELPEGHRVPLTRIDAQELLDRSRCEYTDAVELAASLDTHFVYGPVILPWGPGAMDRLRERLASEVGALPAL